MNGKARCSIYRSGVACMTRLFVHPCSARRWPVDGSVKARQQSCEIGNRMMFQILHEIDDRVSLLGV
jgi:hypothetical protein